MRSLLIDTSRFLLIPETMDSILGEATLYRRRQKLGAITESLDLKGVWGVALERIKEQDRQKTALGMAALMWISHSERPLYPDELSHALAVEIGSTDINSERIPSVETLLSSCLGFIVIDMETSAVRLIHFTLREHLHARPALFGPAHSIMAETCLTYLNFRAIRDISPRRRAPPQSTPFLNYSSLYWGVHARREASRDVVSLALQIFSQIESHICTRLLVAGLISKTGLNSHDIPKYSPLTGFTGLHCASVFGVAELATVFMDHPNCGINGRDFLGITPLIWAAICGQERVAKLLLERPTINPDKPDGCFHRTALLWAARMGHEGIVRLLLGWTTTKPDGTNSWLGKTPRVLNVVRGKTYVDPNWLDKCGQAPILLAAGEGHEAVVKLLLGRKDVKSDKPDIKGRTPLFCAARNGHEGVVKILLKRDDIDPNRLGEYVKTPLYCAVENGHEGVVKILLERDDIDPNRAGGYNTPLYHAVANGHEGIVKILLERDDVSPDTSATTTLDYGQTPLCLAAQNGHEGVMKILLRRDDIDPNKSGRYGKTPLFLAAQDGHEGVVKILLERVDVSPDKHDKNGKTPLWWAAYYGHEGVVRTLLEREDVSPDKPDNEGETPLSCAAQNGHEGIVRTLLEREDVSPNKPDSSRRTPLWHAVRHGHAGVAALLEPRGRM